MDFIQRLPRKALLLQQIEQGNRAPARAEQTEITRHRFAEHRAQTVRIVPVSARDDRDKIPRPNVQPFDCMDKLVTHNLFRLRKPRMIRKRRPVVDDGDRESEHRRNRAERLCDVSASEQNQPLARAENPRVFCSLDDNLQLRRPIASGFVLYGYKLFSHPINPLAGIPSL